MTEPTPTVPATGLARRVVVGLDIADGQVVKCIKFRDPQVIGNPAELGARYEAQGADELVYLDIAASLDGRSKMLQWVERTAEQVFIPFCVVGGIRTLEDFRDLLAAGADKVGINTGAVANPDLVREAADRYGSQCVVLTMDTQPVQRPDGTTFDAVHTHSGRRPTQLEARAWAHQAAELGAGELVYTAIDRDGTRSGYDVELTRQLARELPIPVVASGGAGSIDHVYDVLTKGEADAALVASLVHYDTTPMPEIKQELARRGVPVRPVPPPRP